MKTKFLYNSNTIDQIKYPILTEKTTQLLENNKYSFIVDLKADKNTLKTTIEFLFDVKVIKVNTSNLPKKKKRVGKYLGSKPQY